MVSLGSLEQKEEGGSLRIWDNEGKSCSTEMMRAAPTKMTAVQVLEHQLSLPLHLPGWKHLFLSGVLTDAESDCGSRCEQGVQQLS